MSSVHLPYGETTLVCHWSVKCTHQVILPTQIQQAESGESLVNEALENSLNDISWKKLMKSDSRVSIAINDKTRPVPNNILLPPLLRLLIEAGVKKENIEIIIATGTHIPMEEEEFHLVLPKEIFSTFNVTSHNSEDATILEYLGETRIGTPVLVNKKFSQADLKIVVGDIELHQFAGYSGGVKTAAIGLSGRDTITKNHSLLQDSKATVGVYDHNPLRMDIEEIGKIIKIDLALNAVLSDRKQIVAVFFGDPLSVMKNGMNVVDSMCRTSTTQKFDLVVASAGGYPKDINLYQAQKALLHGSMFCKTGGTLILVSECREGVGSAGYLKFMDGISTTFDIYKKFQETGFQIGPHKALQLAKILEKVNIFIVSEINRDTISKLLLRPLMKGPEGDIRIDHLISENDTVALLPYATACIP